MSSTDRLGELFIVSLRSSFSMDATLLLSDANLFSSLFSKVLSISDKLTMSDIESTGTSVLLLVFPDSTSSKPCKSMLKSIIPHLINNSLKKCYLAPRLAYLRHTVTYFHH